MRGRATPVRRSRGRWFRWRPDGKQLGFNSVHEGSRQVYVIDLSYDSDLK